MTWLDDLSKTIPSAVFSAVDSAGHDLTSVRVLVDGELAKEKLDGSAMLVEPGEHRVSFARPGGGTVDQTYVFLEGEKNRKIGVRFPEDRAQISRKPKASAWPWILGATGVTGVGGFTFFGIWGKSDIPSLDRCAPACGSGAVDSTRAKYLVADISLAVGVVALSVASFLFLRPASHD